MSHTAETEMRRMIAKFEAARKMWAAQIEAMEIRNAVLEQGLKATDAAVQETLIELLALLTIGQTDAAIAVIREMLKPDSEAPVN